METAQSHCNVCIASKRWGRDQEDACGGGAKELGAAEGWKMRRGPLDSKVNLPAAFPAPGRLG